MSSIIMEKGGGKKGKNTQIYTWGACVLVILFLITLISAVSGSKKKENSQEAYRKQAFDLGKMPFSDDEAERYMLASARYEDIAKNDFINGLFSSKQKRERQEADIKEGIPEINDKEYKAAKEEMAIKKNKTKRKNTRIDSPAPKVKTKAGQLNSSSGGSFSSGKGGRGTSGSTGYYGNSKAQNYKRQQGQAALLAQVKGGRDTGFQQAAQLSAAAAGAQNLEAAAAGAADAFQGGAQKESKEFLEGENENNAGVLEVDEDDLKNKLERAGSNEDLEKLDTKLQDMKDKKDKESEQCNGIVDSVRTGNTDCLLGEVLGIAINNIVGGATNKIFGN